MDSKQLQYTAMYNLRRGKVYGIKKAERTCKTQGVTSKYMNASPKV